MPYIVLIAATAYGFTRVALVALRPHTTRPVRGSRR